MINIESIILIGAAFLTLHPTKYAELLQKKMETHNCDAYLVNTGWIGGEYGVGKRISIQKTRSCINAILNGSVKNAPTKKHDVFNVEFPIMLTYSILSSENLPVKTFPLI